MHIGTNALLNFFSRVSAPPSGADEGVPTCFSNLGLCVCHTCHFHSSHDNLVCTFTNSLC